MNESFFKWTLQWLRGNSSNELECITVQHVSGTDRALCLAILWPCSRADVSPRACAVLHRDFPSGSCYDRRCASGCFSHKLKQTDRKRDTPHNRRIEQLFCATYAPCLLVGSMHLLPHPSSPMPRTSVFPTLVIDRGCESPSLPVVVLDPAVVFQLSFFWPSQGTP